MVGVANALDAALGRGNHLLQSIAGQVGQLDAFEVGP
jgi:hypothetical protein